MSKIEKLKHYWNRREDAIVYFKWCLNYTKPYLPQLALLMGFDFLGTFMSVGMAIIGKKLIDKASIGDLSGLWKIIIIYVENLSG